MPGSSLPRSEEAGLGDGGYLREMDIFGICMCIYVYNICYIYISNSYGFAMLYYRDGYAAVIGSFRVVARYNRIFSGRFRLAMVPYHARYIYIYVYAYVYVYVYIYEHIPLRYPPSLCESGWKSGTAQVLVLKPAVWEDSTDVEAPSSCPTLYNIILCSNINNII